MENFLNRISEIESQFTALDSELRAELRATEAALESARERAEGLRTRYRVEALKGSQDALKLKVELGVAEDAVELIQAKAATIQADLNSGELQEAMMRRHAAIVSACECEGNAAIGAALEAAVAARDAYRAALQAKVATQHKVAATARRSYAKASGLGRQLAVPQLVRYSSSEFPIPEPAESQSAASML